MTAANEKRIYKAAEGYPVASIDDRYYKVVLNHEEQYSIWPADRDNPAGWRDAGKRGTKQECLDYIDEVWTDMRPLSLRKSMQENQSLDA